MEIATFPCVHPMPTRLSVRRYTSGRRIVVGLRDPPWGNSWLRNLLAPPRRGRYGAGPAEHVAVRIGQHHAPDIRTGSVPAQFRGARNDQASCVSVLVLGMQKAEDSHFHVQSDIGSTFNLRMEHQTREATRRRVCRFSRSAAFPRLLTCSYSICLTATSPGFVSRTVAFPRHGRFRRIRRHPTCLPNSIAVVADSSL